MGAEVATVADFCLLRRCCRFLFLFLLLLLLLLLLPLWVVNIYPLPPAQPTSHSGLHEATRASRHVPVALLLSFITTVILLLPSSSRWVQVWLATITITITSPPARPLSVLLLVLVSTRTCVLMYPFPNHTLYA